MDSCFLSYKLLFVLLGNFCSQIKMIKSLFKSVSIPDIPLHELMLHLFQTNADKKALVSNISLINYTFMYYVIMLFVPSVF